MNRDFFKQGPWSQLELCSNPHLFIPVVCLLAVTKFQLQFPHVKMPTVQGSCEDEMGKVCNSAEHTEWHCRNGSHSQS